jgi:L-aminopeptidase/D-esterase-like protein
VQCNTSLHRYLRIAGVPVGREISGQNIWESETGSIIVVVATDAPLLPHQLKRVARRVTLALGRLGSISGNGSGDIFIAFSTANSGAGLAEKQAMVATLNNSQMDELFEATVQSTEEAIVNAMIAAKTTTGPGDRIVKALPHDQLQEVLRKYNRLARIN